MCAKAAREVNRARGTGIPACVALKRIALEARVVDTKEFDHHTRAAITIRGRRNSMKLGISRTSSLAMLCCSVAAASGAAHAQKKLAIVRLAFSQSEDGEVVSSKYQFLGGEVLYFSCQVEGYTKTEKDEIRLTFQIAVRDAKGVLLQAPATGKVEANLSPEDKEWMPKLRATILIPPLIPPDEYQLLVKVKDEFANATVNAHSTFRV